MSRPHAGALVGLVAVASAALVVAVAVLQGDDESAPAATAESERAAPPLELGLLIRNDDEAEALREAERLVDEGDREAGRARFEELLAGNPDSVDAAVGAAIASWPDGTVDQLETIVSEHPASGVARLHLGFALLASGDEDGASREWREVERVDPDSSAALRAEDLLNPQFAPGRPPFVAPLRAPSGLAGLSPEEQLAELERQAADGGVDERLLYGSALQRAGRPVSASEAFASALEAEPDSLLAQVADALGRFDKDDPSQTFSRLGPLADRDQDGVVRYHLGLALSWLGEVDEAVRQLRLARAADPDGFYGREAERLLERLEDID